MSDDTAAVIRALATENAELRAALAEAQELLIETAVDAGEMHACVEELQGDLAEGRPRCDERVASACVFKNPRRSKPIATFLASLGYRGLPDTAESFPTRMPCLTVDPSCSP